MSNRNHREEREDPWDSEQHQFYEHPYHERRRHSGRDSRAHFIQQSYQDSAPRTGKNREIHDRTARNVREPGKPDRRATARESEYPQGFQSEYYAGEYDYPGRKFSKYVRKTEAYTSSEKQWAYGTDEHEFDVQPPPTAHNGRRRTDTARYQDDYNIEHPESSAPSRTRTTPAQAPGTDYPQFDGQYSTRPRASRHISTTPAQAPESDDRRFDGYHSTGPTAPRRASTAQTPASGTAYQQFASSYSTRPIPNQTGITSFAPQTNPLPQNSSGGTTGDTRSYPVHTAPPFDYTYSLNYPASYDTGSESGISDDYTQAVRPCETVEYFIANYDEGKPRMNQHGDRLGSFNEDGVRKSDWIVLTIPKYSRWLYDYGSKKWKSEPGPEVEQGLIVKTEHTEQLLEDLEKLEGPKTEMPVTMWDAQFELCRKSAADSGDPLFKRIRQIEVILKPHNANKTFNGTKGCTENVVAYLTNLINYQDYRNARREQAAERRL